MKNKAACKRGCSITNCTEHKCIKGYAWTNGGEGVIESVGKDEKQFVNKYGSNGMPDESANGMFEYAQRKGYEWGTIDTIPEIPGLAVRYNGHVGVYIGNGEVVEERGFAYGCVKTKLKDRGWLHWYKIPTIKYEENVEDLEPVSLSTLGNRLLKKGLKGADVKELQQLLNVLFNAGLEEDGAFGQLTEEAVRKMQAKMRLTIDGLYGAKSHAALMSLLGDRAPDVNEKIEQKQHTQIVTLTNDTAVRVGNNTSCDIITTIGKGNYVEFVLNADNKPLVTADGWYAIKCNDRIGWIKY